MEESFNFIGIELGKDSHATACRRLNVATEQGKLF
jgi:hypothetical protein